MGRLLADPWPRGTGVLLAAAAVLRLALLVWIGPIVYSDTAQYLEGARSILTQGTFSVVDRASGLPSPISGRMPLYSAWIALCMALAGEAYAWAVAASGAAVSVATVALTVRLAAWVAGARAGLVAGAIFAVMPTSLEYGISLLPDAAFAFAMTLSVAAGFLFLAAPGAAPAASWGGTVALGAFVKPILKFYWLPAGALVFWRARRAPIVLAFCCAPVLALSLWMGRNWALGGHAGLDAYRGVNLIWPHIDLVLASTDEERRQDALLARVRDIVARHTNGSDAFNETRRLLGLSMPEADRLFTRLALEVFQRQPLRAAARMGKNAFRFFLSPAAVQYLAMRSGLAGSEMGEPLADLVRSGRWFPVAVNLGARVPLVVLFLVLAPWGAGLLWWQARARPAAVLLAGTVLYHAALCALVDGNDRYRMAVEPVMLALAMVPLARWLRWLASESPEIDAVGLSAAVEASADVADHAAPVA